MKYNYKLSLSKYLENKENFKKIKNHHLLFRVNDSGYTKILIADVDENKFWEKVKAHSFIPLKDEYIYIGNSYHPFVYTGINNKVWRNLSYSMKNYISPLINGKRHKINSKTTGTMIAQSDAIDYRWRYWVNSIEYKANLINKQLEYNKYYFKD